MKRTRYILLSLILCLLELCSRLVITNSSQVYAAEMAQVPSYIHTLPKWLPKEIPDPGKQQTAADVIYKRCQKDFRGPAQQETCLWKKCMAEKMYVCKIFGMDGICVLWTTNISSWTHAADECKYEGTRMIQAIMKDDVFERSIKTQKKYVEKNLKDLRAYISVAPRQYVPICSQVDFRIYINYTLEDESYRIYLSPDAAKWSIVSKSKEKGLLKRDGSNRSNTSGSKSQPSFSVFAIREGNYTIEAKIGQIISKGITRFWGKYTNHGRALRFALNDVLAKRIEGKTVSTSLRVEHPTPKEIILRPLTKTIQAGEKYTFYNARVNYKESCVEPRYINCETEEGLTFYAEKGQMEKNVYTAPNKPENLKVISTSHPELEANLCKNVKFKAQLNYKQEEDTVIAFLREAYGKATFQITPPTDKTDPSIIWPYGGPSIQVTEFKDYKVKAENLLGISDTVTLRVKSRENFPLLKLEEVSPFSKIKVGERKHITAVERYCKGEKPDYRVTDKVKWKSSNDRILHVSPYGRVKGRNPGTAKIELYGLADEIKGPVTNRAIEVYSDKPSFIEGSNQKSFLWVEKRGTWCFFEIGDENELKQLKEDKIWHQIIDGPFNTLEMVEASYDKKASTAKPTRILGHGTLYYHKVGADICFIGRNHNDQITDEPLARINPPLETLLNKETPEKKSTGWTINIKVIDKDKNGEGITGACIKRRGYGFACEAEELGGGSYRLGPIAAFLNQKTKKVDLIAEVYHLGKGVKRTKYFQPKTVELGESPTVSITFQFSFSSEGQDEQKPSFIRASSESKKAPESSNEKKPSFIKASTTKTKSSKPPPAIQTPLSKPTSKKIQDRTKYQPLPKPPTEKQRQPQKLKKQKAKKVVKLSYEQCVKKFCPMCSFLFGQRPTLDNLPEDECGRCMKANKGNISQCLKENQ